MIIVYGGCQADVLVSAEVTESLLARIRGLFQSLKPHIVVGSLTPGADFLFARAALLERESDGVIEVLLPFDGTTFRERTVEPAGHPWLSDYDRITSTAGITMGHCGLAPTDANVGSQHNVALLDRADYLASQQGQRVWVLAVRSAAQSSPPSVTDDLVSRAQERGMLTIDLTPAPESRPRAFIVMPYGKKKDPRANRFVHCDPAFHRVYRPLLEDFDVEWTRADLQTDSGIIHTAMLSDLANSELVVADLSAINFNVAYELGIRHVFAPRATVLIDPDFTSIKRAAPPFDINMIRTHSFTRSLEDVTDEQAEHAIERLRPVMASALTDGGNDSPCHEWFDLSGFGRPFETRSALSTSELTQRSIRDRVAAAAQSGDPDRMRAEAMNLAGTTDISDAARRACRIELAAGLLSEREYDEAVQLLELSKPATEDPLHRTWLHKTVMAYRKVAEGSNDQKLTQQLRATATRYLAEAEDSGYRDSETYGIWGGLLKRQIKDQRPTVEAAVAESLFAAMEEKYRQGFMLDPDYYTGVNVVMALRWSGQSRTSEFARDFNEVLTVSRFLAQRALTEDPQNFWAAVTLAELTLHEALESQTASVDDAVRRYADAARLGRPGEIDSAVFQVEFLRTCGEPDEVINRVLAALGREVEVPQR